MLRKLSSLLFILSFASTLPAQENCGFDHAHKALLAKDASYRFNTERQKIDWARFQKLNSSSKLIINGLDTVYEIPLVFHIVHTGGPVGSPGNPTDAQIIDLVDYVNKAFQAQWAGYPSTANGGTRVPFKFVLAKRDPSCLPTTGINRVDGSGLPDYIMNGISYDGPFGAPDVDVKNLSRWPNDQYYNIWIVNTISGGGGVAGYAYYPGAGPLVDGTVVAAPYTNPGDITLVHEIGHGMGLPHTFEGDDDGVNCPPNVDCTIDGDGICDTEPHKRSILCSETTNPCTGTSMNLTQHSFMSYTHGCQDRFTKGQKDKMLFNLINNRTSLMHSIGSVEPPPAPIAATCIPAMSNPGSMLDAGPREVHFNYIHKITGGFTTDGVSYQDFFCTDQTEVFTGETYTITVKTGYNIEHLRVFIDYNNNGSFEPTELAAASTGNTYNQVHTAAITIPTTAVVCQPLRMRVIADVIGAQACGPLAHGQAEDYVVIAKPPSGAQLATTVTSNFPTCKDSVVSFNVSGVNVPASASYYWFLNGSHVATGTTYSSNDLKNGDVVTNVTVINNPVCNTPDTVRSNPVAINHLPPVDLPPVISLIGNLLVSDKTPVQWFGPGGAAIPGATSQTYHPSQYGYYYAVVTGTPCPSDSSNVLLVSLLTLNELDPGQLNVYPIPASDRLNIETSDGIRLSRVDIYNTVGQQLMRKTVGGHAKTQVEVHILPPGIYFAAVTDQNGNTGVIKFQVSR